MAQFIPKRSARVEFSFDDIVDILIKEVQRMTEVVDGGYEVDDADGDSGNVTIYLI